MCVGACRRLDTRARALPALVPAWRSYLQACLHLCCVQHDAARAAPVACTLVAIGASADNRYQRGQLSAWSAHAGAAGFAEAWLDAGHNCVFPAPSKQLVDILLLHASQQPGAGA